MSKKWTKGMVSVGLIGALFCGGIVAYAATDTTTSGNGQGFSFSHHFGFKGEKGKFEGRGHGAFLGGPYEKHLEDLAAIFSMDKDALKRELQSGKTILEIAQEKGVSKDDLITKLVSAAQAQIDKAVTDGKLSSDKAAQMKENLKDRITAMVEKKFEPGKGDFKGSPMGKHFEGLAAILGMEQSALKTELQSGKTILDIAQAKGISKDDLIAKMVADAETRIDQAVKDGKLTSDKAVQMKANLKDRLIAAVERKADPSKADGKRGMLGNHLQKVTEILNMQPNELRDEMKAGKSLAEIAQSKGIAPEDLKAKLIEAAKQDIDSLVQQGKMTQEKADQVKQGLEKRIDGMINHKPGTKKGTKTQQAQPVQ
ncbi:hypothetical protein GJ688_09630 [Heliobacillus mobilis]|uniref:Uncharacterized protein n=1 Tax=Heliobacterium mobile TaxID=28064 RepID=A0A6I3SL69_HELMO|nr:hypothetical protein [Heliobacterium mobile]MTV49237.1 hypothetical protein [Heliobacterium mobile]